MLHRINVIDSFLKVYHSFPRLARVIFGNFQKRILVWHQPAPCKIRLSYPDFMYQFSRRTGNRFCDRAGFRESFFSPKMDLVLKNRRVRRLHNLLNVFPGSAHASGAAQISPRNFLHPPERRSLSRRSLCRQGSFHAPSVTGFCRALGIRPEPFHRL